MDNELTIHSSLPEAEDRGSPLCQQGPWHCQNAPLFSCCHAKCRLPAELRCASKPVHKRRRGGPPRSEVGVLAGFAADRLPPRSLSFPPARSPFITPGPRTHDCDICPSERGHRKEATTNSALLRRCQRLHGKASKSAVTLAAPSDWTQARVIHSPSLLWPANLMPPNTDDSSPGDLAWKYFHKQSSKSIHDPLFGGGTPVNPATETVGDVHLALTPSYGEPPPSN